MKQKVLSILALLLVAVTGAWAAVTPISESYSSTSTAAGWSTSTVGRFDPVVLSEGDNYFLSVNQEKRNNNGTIVTGTILNGKAAAGDNFTLMFDMRLGSSNNQSPVSLEIKDAANSDIIFSLTATATNVPTWKINGSTTTVTLPNSGTGTATDGSAINAITWISYKISRKGVLTYLTITNKETSDVIFERQIVQASETGGLGNIVFTTKRYNANFAIDNIELRALQDVDVPDVAPVKYTIKYQDESANKIKDDVVTTSYVDAEVTASDAQMAAIYVDNKKYIYKSGNKNLTLAAEEASNVITLVYREAENCSYTINAVDGENNVLKTLHSGTVFEGEVVQGSYPKYINNGGTLYTKDATNKQYYINETIDSNEKVINYTYTATNITNVVFLTEGEDIAGATVINTGNALIRSSNAASGYAESNLELVTLPAGTYNINGVGHFPSSGNRTTAITDGTNNVLEIKQKEVANNWIEANNTITLTAETTLYLAICDKNSALDFLYIQRVTKDVQNEWIQDIPEQTYTGEAITPTIEVKDGETTLVLDTDYTVEYANNITVPAVDATDEQLPTVTITGKGNYSGTATKTFSIVKADITMTTAPAATENLTYSSEAQTLITAGVASFGTVVYSLDGENFSDGLPQGTDAGTYTVYYKVEGDDNHNAFGVQTLTATISKADITMTTTPAAIEGLVYSGEAQTLITAGVASFGTVVYSLDGENFSDGLPQGTDAGTYTVYYKLEGDDNHNAFDAQTLTATISKADITMTTAPAAVSGLLYSGEAQTLITAGVASIGTVVYSLDGTTFSDDLPQGTDAGTYTVYYKVEGDNNHNTFDAQTLTVTIAANKEALNNAITEATNYKNSISESHPTAANDLQTAIDEAQNVYDNANATSEQVDAAFTALDAALNAAKVEVAKKRITLTIPAKSYVSRVDADKREIENAVTGVKLYSVKSVTDTEVELTDELSVIAAEMPYLIYNDNDTEVEVSIVVSTAEADNVDYDSEHFKGTLVDKTFTDEDMSDADHYVLTGKNFVWVKDAGTLAASKAWLEISATADNSRTLRIVFGNSLTGIEGIATDETADDNADWYDLNGRRLQGKPASRGVYIKNGKKIVIK